MKTEISTDYYCHSPDRSEKPTAKTSQFFFAKKSDLVPIAIGIFFWLGKWLGWQGLVAKSWMKLQQNLTFFFL
jgi:hypothetical protein